MSERVAVVTGASRGIGKQFCVDLARAGYNVVCAARSASSGASRLPGSVDETAALVEKEGRSAMRAPLDVRDEAQISALADRVYGEWGRCDLLVNNAAIAPPTPALQDSTKRWRLAVDINVNGPFYLMYYLCPRMPDEGGRVVNISSGAAVTPSFGRASYTATKLALEGMSQSLAHDLRGQVAVNVIRLDLAVWSEGFADTLPADIDAPFEHPIIMSDALLWLAEQPIDFTGHVLDITALRAQGIVRPQTLYKDYRPNP
jgi:NAD(P)-dependent dehydrogenase (short-subunit alcohol dehydrogenase family)